MSGKLKQQRNRASLVCFKCKEKKIKCDRMKPCINCIKVGSADQCTYTYKVVKLNKTDDSKASKRILQVITDDEVMNPTSDSTERSLSLNSNINSSFNIKNAGIEKKNSILQTEINLQSNSVIYRKPSRTQIRPAVFTIFQKKSLPKYTLAFKNLFDKERRQWKSQNFRKTPTSTIHQFNIESGGDSAIVKELEELICNNYYAVLERLNYFQSSLNEILFNSYIPMGAVQLIFHHYFVMKPDGIQFKGIKKKYEYSFIALISSLISLTNVFTKNDAVAFNFVLPFNDCEFDNLTIMLMNESNYRRKQSIFTIYTLLNLRLSLMVYGDAQSSGVVGQNSLPYFQLAVNIASEIGLNKNQDKVTFTEPPMSGDNTNDIYFAREIPTDSLKRLWNYMLTVDAIYSITIHSPPLIDERYNHGVYPIMSLDTSYIERFVTTIREGSLIFNVDKPVSIEKILKQIDNISKLMESLEPLHNIQLIENDERKWENMNIKMKLVKYYCSMNIHLLTILSDESRSQYFSDDGLLNEENQQLLLKLREDIMIKIKISFLIGSDVVLQMSEKKLNHKFLIYARDVFSDWLGFESAMLIYDIVNKHVPIERNIPVVDEETQVYHLPKPPRLDINVLEYSLYHFEEEKEHGIGSIIERATEAASFASYLTNLYERTIEIPTILTNYKFFVMTKVLLVSIYFLYCHIKNTSTASFSASANANRLLDQTKQILKQHFHNGKISHLISADKVMNDNKKNGRDVDSRTPEEESYDNSLEFDNLYLEYVDNENLSIMFEEINQLFQNNQNL